MQALQSFAETFPKRPRCANEPQYDHRIRTAAKAKGYRLVQPNTAGLMTWLCFDIDRPAAAMDWQDVIAPPPNLVCQNPDNGHAHLLYQLETPVCISVNGRDKPIRYAEAVEEGLRSVLRGDRGYGGNLVKNPLCGFWRVSSWSNEAYSLEELADYVDLIPRIKRRDPDHFAGLGRNCETFDRLRTLAYRQVKEFWRPGGDVAFSDWCLRAAVQIQTDFVEPLPAKEVQTIAKSVARWCWKRFNPAEFRQIQSARGRRKGADTKAKLLPQVIEMRAQGHSLRVIGDTLGINHATVRNWLSNSGV